MREEAWSGDLDIEASEDLAIFLRYFEVACSCHMGAWDLRVFDCPRSLHFQLPHQTSFI
jgi:hypothetical protein